MTNAAANVPEHRVPWLSIKYSRLTEPQQRRGERRGTYVNSSMPRTNSSQLFRHDSGAQITPVTVKPLSPFSCLSLLPLAAAIDSSPIVPRQWSTEGISQTNGPAGPWNISSEDWASIMDEPDLEVVFPIDGYNISSPDDMESIDGWTITVSVRTEIPGQDVIGAQRPYTDFAGSLVRLNPPESLVELARSDSNDSDVISLLDSSWRLCVSSFSFTPLQKRDDVTTDDGSCRTVFSDECIRALEERRNTTAYEDGCTVANIPSECDYEGTGGVIPLSGRYSTWAGEDVDDIDWLSGSQLSSVATDTYPRGDDRNGTIDRVTRYTDFMVISWVHNATDSRQAILSQSLVCPKAVNAIGGDNDFGGGDEDEGNGNDDNDDDGGNAGARMSASLTACVLGVLMALVL